jgi:type IV secretory pathway VirB4 component
LRCDATSCFSSEMKNMTTDAEILKEWTKMIYRHETIELSITEKSAAIRLYREAFSQGQKASAKNEEKIIADYEKRKAQQEETDRIEDAKARRR